MSDKKASGRYKADVLDYVVGTIVFVVAGALELRDRLSALLDESGLKRDAARLPHPPKPKRSAR